MTASPTTPTASTSHRIARTGFLLALGSAALFSLKGIVVKLALARGVTIETLMLWRMGLALPVYVAVGLRLFRARTGQAPLPARRLVQAAALGVLSYHVCTWLDFTALRYISAQFERVVLFTYPLLTAVLARLFLGERFTRRHAAALVLAYAGVALVFGSEIETFGQGAWKGTALVFGAAVLFALYAVLAKPVIGALGPKAFTCAAMTAATLGVVTHNLVQHGLGSSTNHGILSPTAVLAGAFLAGVCTVLPSFMLSEAIARIGPARTSAAGNIGPVVTTVLAVLILGEPFGVPQAVGLVLILIGVYRATKPGNAP